MIDTKKLQEEQLKLSNKIICTDTLKTVKTIAGIDIIVIENKVIVSIVVCSKDYKELESVFEISNTNIPYIKGYLFYREGPAILEAFNKLKTKPDLIMVKGSGILHPRRLGMASHLGLLLDTPTIGITKKLLMGEVKDTTVYVDKEARGYYYKTREHSNPIIISPGHKISLKRSMELVKESIKYPHKLPEPLHLAHKLATKLKKVN